MRHNYLKALFKSPPKIGLSANTFICILMLSVFVIYLDYSGERDAYLYPATTKFIWIFVPLISIFYAIYLATHQCYKLLSDLDARDIYIRRLRARFGDNIAYSHWRFYFFTGCTLGIPLAGLVTAFIFTMSLSVMTRSIAFIPFNRVMLINHIHVYHSKGYKRLNIAFSDLGKPEEVALSVSLLRSKVDLKDFKDIQESASFKNELACVRGYEMPWGLAVNEVISPNKCTRKSKWDWEEIKETN